MEQFERAGLPGGHVGVDCQKRLTETAASDLALDAIAVVE